MANDDNQQQKNRELSATKATLPHQLSSAGARDLAPDIQRAVHLLRWILTTLIILFSLGTGIAEPLYLGSYAGLLQEPIFWAGVGVIACLAVAAIVSRTPHYQLAAGLAIGAIYTAIFISGANSGAPFSIMAYLVLSVLLSGLFFSYRGIIVTVAAGLLGIVILPLFVPGTNNPDLISVMTYFVIVSALLLVVTHHRNLQEQDRQHELREANAALRRRLDLEECVTALSTKFLSIDIQEIDDVLTEALETIGTFAQADHSFVVLRLKDEQTEETGYEWTAEGAGPLSDGLRELLTSAFPWWQERMTVFEPLHISCVTDLPVEASAEKRLFESLGVQSLAAAPMLLDGEQLGFVGIDTACHEGTWADDVVSLLQIAGSIFVNVLLRRQSENAVRSAKDELEIRVAERTQALEQSANRLELLHQIDQAILTACSPEEISGEALQSLRQLIPCDRASVVSFDLEAREFTVLSAWTKRSTRLASGVKMPLGAFGGNIQQLRLGRVNIVSDLNSVPQLSESDRMLIDEGIRTYISVPLIAQTVLIGSLNLAGGEPNVFGSEHIEVASEVARQMAVALQQARLQEDERQQHALVEALNDTAAAINSTLDLDEVLEYILATVGQLVPHQAASVMLLEGDKVWAGRRTGSQSSGRRNYDSLLSLSERPLLKHMADSRQPVVVDDTCNSPDWIETATTRWVRSYVGAPIVSDNEVIGFLNLDSDEPGYFTALHARHLRTFALQAAIAIQNARHYVESQDRNRRLALLNEITRISTATLDLDTLLRRLADVALEIAQSDGCYLTLWDADQQRTIPAAASGALQERYTNIRPQPGEATLTETVIGTGQPLVVDDAYHTSHLAPRIARLFPTRSLLALPLLAGGRPLGALILAFDTHHHFAQEDIEWAEQAAELIALAVAKAQVYETLEQRVADRTTELRTVSERVQTILDNSPDTILLLGSDGLIRTGNLKALDMFGFTIDELHGRHPTILVEVSSGQMLTNALRTVVDSRRTMQFEAVAKHNDGQSFDAGIALAPIEEGDAISGFVCTIRDVSSQKAVERMKDEFLATAAHELRTPLTSIQGFSEILLTRSLESARQKRYLTMINEQSTQLARIINELLDLSRLEANRGLSFDFEPVQVDALVVEVLQPFLDTSPDHRFELEGLLADLPPVHADRFRLAQVLRNLVSNAVKYSPEGGRITLRGQITGDALQISVQDDGIGMTADQQSHLFEKFYRANSSSTQGTGLGLAISKLIVEGHGGQIRVESAPGSGSTFSFNLPLCGLGHAETQ